MKPPVTLLPGALVVALAGVLIWLTPAPLLAQAARGYPFVVLAATALFAWRLHRPRLLAAAIVILVIHASFGSGRLVQVPLAWAITASSVPIGIALLCYAPDRGFVRHFAIVLAPAALVGFFSAANPVNAAELLSNTWLPSIVAASVAAVGAWRSRRPVEAGLFWLVIAVSAAMMTQTSDSTRAAWLLAAGVVLGATLAEVAYALAYHDELTGLPSRRALVRALGALEPPYAIAILDVDHFKKFNDEYGHDVGDQVLRMVAAKLAQVGGGGTAYRSGGEEFTLVFPASNKRQAAENVEAVREAVANASFVLRNHPRPTGKSASSARGRAPAANKRLQVTVSAGVASGAGKSYEEVLHKADQAMYRAKAKGRNCVIA